MSLMIEVINESFAWALRTSTYTAVAIALVLLVQTLFAKRLAPRWRYALWAVVIARALAPALPQSAWSVFNFTPDVTPAPVATPASTSMPPSVVVYLKAGNLVPSMPSAAAP